MKSLAAAVATCFPPDVGCGVAFGQISESAIFREELAIAQDFGAIRRADFFRGRKAASEALRALHIEPSPILIGEHGVPLFPRTLAGSISHTRDVGVAVAGHRASWSALGIDIQRVVALSERVIAKVISDNEQRALDPLRAPLSLLLPELACIAFAAKEAIYKAYFSRVGRRFGFDAVELQFSQSGIFEGVFTRDEGELVKKSDAVVGRFALHGNDVIAGVALAAF